jgi:hypothetical protein
MTSRSRGLAAAALGVVLCWNVAASAGCRRSTLPSSMTDQAFWRLSEELSEPAGSFTVSDNLVSNEPHVAENARWLGPRGGVYVGVGPEQNFSYISRLRPGLAFIVDIRRENRSLHLFYKALFELSADRVDFVSRLFSRAPPADLSSRASADEIFKRYDGVPPSPDLYGRNAALIRERLLTAHGFPLSAGDLQWIERVFKAFYVAGPAIHFWGTQAVDAVRPSYRQLMTTRDGTGQVRSFLASEDDFEVVKDLQSRNLIVPVIGDFGGPSALIRVGEYVRQHAAEVEAFYGSNVGVYLTNQQTRTFCAHLAGLPAASNASFIERDGVRTFASKVEDCLADVK